jgi:hypothetical protein
MKINLCWLSCDELQFVPESEGAGVTSKKQEENFRADYEGGTATERTIQAFVAIALLIFRLPAAAGKPEKPG